MRASLIAGIILVLVGLFLLYLLRGLLIQIILLALGVIGVVIAIILVIIGLGLIFGGMWGRGRWKRYITVET
jgi:hypothetical protein